VVEVASASGIVGAEAGGVGLVDSGEDVVAAAGAGGMPEDVAFAAEVVVEE